MVAVYDYDPFGQPIVATGSYARQNPWRFSDEYTDDETGLVYYGYRYYQPSLGKWINRDPSGETGSINLNALLNNDGLNYTDFLGLWKAEGQWRGGWGKYEGIAVADCKDTLGKLAHLITGHESDWRALGRTSDKVNEGEKVDIAPLLELLEKRLRTQVVRNTRQYKPIRFGYFTPISPVNTASVLPYFGGGYGESDCTQAYLLVYAKSIIDVFTADQFDRLRIPNLRGGFNHVYLKDRDIPGSPGEMLVGDSTYIENYPEYGEITRERSPENIAGPWIGDNVIKVASGRYWLYTGAENYRDMVKTIEGFRDDLREAYRGVGGTPGGRRDYYPHPTGRITFIDTALVARKVFDERNR